MNTVRINLTLPAHLGHKIKALKRGQRVLFITEAAEEKFKKIEREKMDQLLEKGYAARANDDRKLNDEFDHMAGDGL